MLAALFALFGVASTVPTGETSRTDVEVLVERMQAHYDALEGFEADFTQRYERKILRRAVEESGRVIVKKPGRMRWEYRTPEEKLFVTDGSRSYFYLPIENQVMVSHHPRGAMGMGEGSPFELLAGRSRMTDSFAFFESDAEPTRGGEMLHLIPTRRHEEFEDVEVEVQPKTGALLRVVLIDMQRNRTEFVFDNVRKDLDLPESLFRFTIPADAEVVVHSDDPPGAP
jgi:outer membrane lipoprotein carrier protein